MTNEMVGNTPAVSFEASVTYCLPYQGLLFVQDGDASIFVFATALPALLPGDRILIKGTLHPSFHPMVHASEINFLHHGRLPAPLPATYEQLLQSDSDCRLVKVRAVLRSADTVSNAGNHITLLNLLSGGGEINAVLNGVDDDALKSLLDAELEVTAVVGERFDRKMQRTGIVLNISSLADIKVLKHPYLSPWSLPLTPMDEVFKGYKVFDAREWVRVHGVVTLYDPGAAVVLQDGSKSIWISTQTRIPLKVGDLADASGFPDSRAGHLTLISAEILDRRTLAPVVPLRTTSGQLALKVNTFDLVELEGKVVTEARTASKDEYVLESDGLVFSAVYRRPSAAGGEPFPEMKQIPVGAKVRVTGVCVPEDSGRYDRDRSFNLVLRTNDDIALVAGPSPVNTRSLLTVVSVLLFVIALGAAYLVRARRVQKRTQAAAVRIEREASLERLRSRILEDINGSCPLSEVLEQIAALVVFKLDDGQCWLQIPELHWGAHPVDRYSSRIVQREILGRAGSSLGALYVAFDASRKPNPEEAEALSAGAALSALAIETRKLYMDLFRRSEFDLLTNLHNRFSLDRHLEARIGGARQNAATFGLIYIDLDKFKEINDLYGHRVGDLFLCEVALRLAGQLRSVDMLARMGGDEFAALTPDLQSRADVLEIAQRLEHCFEAPFFIEGHSLRGSASMGIALYPEDGIDREALFSVADGAMYAVKHSRQQVSEDMLAE